MRKRGGGGEEARNGGGEEGRDGGERGGRREGGAREDLVDGWTDWQTDTSLL